MLETILSVWAQQPEFEAQSRELALRLGVPFCAQQDEPDADYVLIYADTGLQLKPLGKGVPGPIQAEFAAGKAQFRRLHGGGELITKAVGMQQKKNVRILDATAGLGRDAFVMASSGAEVWMCERSPVIHALLLDALERAKNNSELAGIVKQMHLQHVNSLNFIKEIVTEHKIEVIYLDPMFPEREKSALVKKEMRIFKDIVGEDLDADQLLETAIAANVHRVVVKRSRNAPVLAFAKPSHVVEGKSSRFDVYAFKKLA